MYLGLFSIILAIFSLTISIVPGAFSILGLLISLAALLLSSFSVRNKNQYFIITMIIVIIGLIFVNDGLRIWDPLEMPLNFKLVLYGLFVFVVIVSIIIARKISDNKP